MKAFESCVVLLMLGLGSTPLVASGEEPDPPPAAGVFRAQLDGLEVHEVVLPELPLASAAWPGGGIAVLTRPAKSSSVDSDDGDLDDGVSDDGDSEDLGTEEHNEDVARDQDQDGTPRTLYRLRGQAGDLEPVVRNLPSDLTALYAAGGQLWLGGEGTLWRLDGEQLTLVLEQPGLDLESLVQHGLLTEDSLWLPDVGRLRHFRLSDSGAHRLELLEERPLPISAERRRRALILRSRPVTRLESGALIIGPETVGPTRVRHELLSELLGEGESFEAWSRLPAPEDVESSFYAELDGQPIFLATTTEADRLGIFEKLKLRVFRLTPDRTRTGRQPLFAAESETLNWYRFEPVVVDMTGDGKDDLVLIQPDGMGAGNLVLELYEGRMSRFDPKPRRSKLDAESASWHFGTDFDGDGVPDLVVATRSLEIYRGLADHRSRVVEKSPWRTLDPDALARARTEIVKVAEEKPTSDERPSFRSSFEVGDFSSNLGPEIAVVRGWRGRSVITWVHQISTE